MTFKEWHAVVQLIGQAVVSIWLVFDATRLTAAEWTIGAVAAKLLWVIGFMVAFNIAGLIAVSIGVAITRRQDLKDEKADERDLAIAAKGHRNAYRTVSAGGLALIIFLATGQDPVLGVYLLFAILMLGSTADALSQLVHYRIG